MIFQEFEGSRTRGLVQAQQNADIRARLRGAISFGGSDAE